MNKEEKNETYQEKLYCSPNDVFRNQNTCQKHKIWELDSTGVRYRRGMCVYMCACLCMCAYTCDSFGREVEIQCNIQFNILLFTGKWKNIINIWCLGRLSKNSINSWLSRSFQLKNPGGIDWHIEYLSVWNQKIS